MKITNKRAVFTAFGSVILAMALIFGVAGCDNGGGGDDGGNPGGAGTDIRGITPIGTNYHVAYGNSRTMTYFSSNPDSWTTITLSSDQFGSNTINGIYRVDDYSILVYGNNGAVSLSDRSYFRDSSYWSKPEDTKMSANIRGIVPITYNGTTYHVAYGDNRTLAYFSDDSWSGWTAINLTSDQFGSGTINGIYTDGSSVLIYGNNGEVSVANISEFRTPANWYKIEDTKLSAHIKGIVPITYYGTTYHVAYGDSRTLAYFTDNPWSGWAAINLTSDQFGSGTVNGIYRVDSNVLIYGNNGAVSVAYDSNFRTPTNWIKVDSQLSAHIKGITPITQTGSSTTYHVAYGDSRTLSYFTTDLWNGWTTINLTPDQFGSGTVNGIYIHNNSNKVLIYGNNGAVSVADLSSFRTRDYWTKTDPFDGRAPTITTTSLEGGTVDVFYYQQLSATGNSPVTWTVVSGKLPDGMEIWESTITGMPTTAGTFNFTVKATNSKGTDTKDFSIVIAPASTLTWAAVEDTTFGDTAPQAIAYGNGKFVAVGSGKAAYSSDGITWTAVTDSAIGTVGYNIAWGNDKFVAVGYQGKMAYSSDGIAWTAVTDSTFGTSDAINGIAWGNGKFVVGGGRDGSTSSGKMAYSTDGVTWTNIDTEFSAAVSYARIYSVTWGNGKFVAGCESGKMAYSTDGITWTAVTNSTFDSGSYIRAIAWGNDKFVAGSGGKMAYSTDGIAWTAVTGNTIGGDYPYINAIAWGDGQFVVVGTESKMSSSSDGIIWSAVANTTFGIGNYYIDGELYDIPSADSINSIAYGNGKFVAVGSTYGNSITGATVTTPRIAYSTN